MKTRFSFASALVLACFVSSCEPISSYKTISSLIPPSATYSSDISENIPQDQKTIAIPVGSDPYLAPTKKALKKAGWTVYTYGAGQNSKEMPAKYKLMGSSTLSDDTPVYESEKRYNNSVSIVDNQTGAEIVSATGKDMTTTEFVEKLMADIESRTH